jgi:hypothetical protein
MADMLLGTGRRHTRRELAYYRLGPQTGPPRARRRLVGIPPAHPGAQCVPREGSSLADNFRSPPPGRRLTPATPQMAERQVPPRAEATLRDWLDWPRQGVLFDVEHNGFWLDTWGPRPASIEEALRAANNLIAAAPRLIPIYSHRMITDEPHSAGNPVFSVHQTDIMVYGFNLADYLRHEFGLPGREPWPEQLIWIRFWDLDSFQNVR